MPVIFQNRFVAVCRSNRTYDFLRYNDRHTWEKVDPPLIEGIYVNYAQHALANRETHLTLQLGRKTNNIDIRITRDILKPAIDNTWICVVILNNGKTFQNPNERLHKRDIPILTSITQPVLLGRWIEPNLPPQEDDIAPPPPNLVIPSYVPSEYDSIFRFTYNTIIPIWYAVSSDPDSPENPNVITRTIFDRYIQHMAKIVRNLNTTRIMPKHISRLVAQDAIARNEICPITMDPITIETCSVTSCFHVFERDALALWHVTNKTCPVCKQDCAVNVVE
jgi:hypothetical protein